MIYGDLANSEALSSAIRGQSNTSPYSRTVPVASNAVSYGGELGINLRSLFPKLSTRLPCFSLYQKMSLLT